MASNPLFRARYWREYPWPLQLLLLLLLVMTLASLMTAVAFVVVPLATGQNTSKLSSITPDSPRAVVHGALWYQGLVSAGMFLLPAMLFAYLSHPSPARYLGLRKPGHPLHWIYTVGCIVGATPVFLLLEGLMRKLLPADSAAQAANDNIVKAFLDTRNPLELAGVLVVIAVLAPLGEELFFRGVLFRFVAKRSRNIWFPLIASAAFFAFVHTGPSGYLPIFGAGMLLAAFYYLTGSVWCGIVAHAVYNGGQALLIYAAKFNPSLRGVLEASSLPLYIVILGAALGALCFYALWRSRTPLQPGWASDGIDSSVHRS